MPGRRRILLVDDDRAMLEHLARLVGEAGYAALIARSWAEALQTYRDEHPDLVLLDVMMPTIDGYKLARVIKAEAGAGSFVPIILVTALEDAESKRRGMAAGADDFLTKPIGALELGIRIGAMLRIKDLNDQLMAANLKLAELSVTDSLTGLQNRRSLYANLEREFSRARRYGHALTLLMVDIDHFKQVNDSYGHQAGDRVLCLVAEAVRSTVRVSDVAGRFGGEEFMVLAPETGKETVHILCDRIRAEVVRASAASGIAGFAGLTISIGAATTEMSEAKTGDDLVRLADEALYKAKHAGRDRAVVYGE